MQKVIPTNGYVLCKRINEVKVEDYFNGFAFDKEQLPEYEILDVKNPDSMFKNGDIVIANAIPTKVKLSEDEEYYLIKEENIASKMS